MLGALHPHGPPPMGGLSRHDGPGPLGPIGKRQSYAGVKHSGTTSRSRGPAGGKPGKLYPPALAKRQAASSLDDVVGLDLNNLSEEQLKELDGENVAARDVTHPTNGGRLSQRDAEPTAVAARDLTHPTDGPGPITKRDAAPTAVVEAPVTSQTVTSPTRRIPQVQET